MPLCGLENKCYDHLSQATIICFGCNLTYHPACADLPRNLTKHLDDIITHFKYVCPECDGKSLTDVIRSIDHISLEVNRSKDMNGQCAKGIEKLELELKTLTESGSEANESLTALERQVNKIMKTQLDLISTVSGIKDSIKDNTCVQASMINQLPKCDTMGLVAAFESLRDSVLEALNNKSTVTPPVNLTAAEVFLPVFDEVERRAPEICNSFGLIQDELDTLAAKITMLTRIAVDLNDRPPSVTSDESLQREMELGRLRDSMDEILLKIDSFPPRIASQDASQVPMNLLDELTSASECTAHSDSADPEQIELENLASLYTDFATPDGHNLTSIYPATTCPSNVPVVTVVVGSLRSRRNRRSRRPSVSVSNIPNSVNVPTLLHASTCTSDFRKTLTRHKVSIPRKQGVLNHRVQSRPGKQLNHPVIRWKYEEEVHLKFQSLLNAQKVGMVSNGRSQRMGTY